MSEEAKRNARLEVVREVEEALDQSGDGDLRQTLGAICAAIRDAGGDIPKDLQLQMFFRTIPPVTDGQGCAANPPRPSQPRRRVDYV